MVDDVGVGYRRSQVAAAVAVVDPEGGVEAVGSHPAVAVPLGGAAFDAHAVEHAVAEEPVPGRLARVGAVAQVPAVEFSGDSALHGQVVFGELVGYRRVVPALIELAGVGQVGGVRGGIGHDHHSATLPAVRRGRYCAV